MGMVQSVGPGFLAPLDADANVLFSAMSTTPTAARQNLYNNLIVGMKRAGIWDLLDALWVLAAHTSQAALLNIKSPGIYNCTVNGALTFTVDRGYGNDATASRWISTGINPTGGAHFSRNSASAFAWGAASDFLYNPAIGSTGNSPPTNGIYDSFLGSSAGTAAGTLYQTTNTTWTGDLDGLLAINRPNATTEEGYTNGVLKTSPSRNSVAPTDIELIFFNDGKDTGSYDGTIRAGGFGGSLTATQHAALYNVLFPFLHGVGAV